MRYYFFLILLILKMYNASNLWSVDWVFIKNQNEISELNCSDLDIMCASIGRSGSTMLTKSIKNNFPDRKILKTHILPPQNFAGKIIFIFSNPYHSIESVMNQFRDSNFTYNHIRNLESSSLDWHLPNNQYYNNLIIENLFKVDLLGLEKQLKDWVYNLEEANENEAKVMAIKYEKLWDDQTQKMIAKFLNVDEFKLPVQKSRGIFKNKLSKKEKRLLQQYNIGSVDNPYYEAYEVAYDLWKNAPDYSFHSLKKTSENQ